MSDTTIDAGNDVGRYIQGVMNRHGWSLRDVSERAGERMKKPFSYEHLRKIIRGNTSPSADILEKVAIALDIDAATLMEMHHRSTITRRFGREYLDAMEITPEMYKVDSLMKGLTPEQRKMVLSQLKALVNGNVAKGIKVVAPRASRHRRRRA